MTFRFTIMTLCCTTLIACSPQTESQNPTPATASATTSASSTTSPAIQGKTLAIQTIRGEATVPLNPERIAVYDLGMLDTLHKMGVNIGASVDSVRLDYLNDSIKNAQKAGTLFEPNYEVLSTYQPQLIIIGSRMGKAFEQLNTIAPTIEMTADTKNMKESAKERIRTFGQIFNKTAEAEKLNSEIDSAFDAAKQAAQGKGKGLVVLVNGGKLSAYGPTSRLGGWIHKDIGIPEVDPNIKEGSHGQPISFEYIKQHNPDWLFVLDRSAAIGEEGQAAKDVLNNPLIAETNAWKKGQVVYLIPGSYLAAGGAQQLIDSANQLTEAFKAAK